jgi:predicted PurR-regulated permease PerM
MMNSMFDSWMGYGSFGASHWLIFAAFVAIVLYPIGRILNRLGLSPFWSVLALIPLVNFVALWVLALTDWPIDDGKRG